MRSAAVSPPQPLVQGGAGGAYLEAGEGEGLGGRVLARAHQLAGGDVLRLRVRPSGARGRVGRARRPQAVRLVSFIFIIFGVNTVQ